MWPAGWPQLSAFDQGHSWRSWRGRVSYDSWRGAPDVIELPDVWIRLFWCPMWQTSQCSFETIPGDFNHLHMNTHANPIQYVSTVCFLFEYCCRHYPHINRAWMTL